MPVHCYDRPLGPTRQAHTVLSKHERADHRELALQRQRPTPKPEPPHSETVLIRSVADAVSQALTHDTSPEAALDRIRKSLDSALVIGVANALLRSKLERLLVTLSGSGGVAN